jgi:xanthine dehydrogenase molybdopterin-binding subunit B
VDILQYVAVDDCGRVINQYLVDAQVHGALAQGIGQALYEEVIYDESGQMLSSTLMDYTMPNARQVPDFITDVVETPSPINPLGAKGIGEGGTIGAPPAIVNAVLDALAPLGIVTVDMERAGGMDVTLTKIQRQAAAEAIRVTQHAQEEMDAEEITLDEVLAAIANGQILEDYSEHRRGPCCLLYGRA